MKCRPLSVASVAMSVLILAGCSTGSGGDGSSASDPTSPSEASTSVEPADPVESPDTLEARPIVAGTCWDGSRLQDDQQAFDDAVDTYSAEAADRHGDSANIDVPNALADDPAFAAQVDCSEPHRLEVTGVVKLPEDLEQQVESYSDLLMRSTPLYEDVRANVVGQCAQQFSLLDEVSASVEVEMTVLPVTTNEQTAIAWDPVPGGQWEGGDHSFVCQFRQSGDGLLTFEDLWTPSFPIDQRICFDRSRQLIPCTEPHTVERLAVFGLDAAVADGDLPGADGVAKDETVNFSDAEWAAFDQACSTYVDAVPVELASGLVPFAESFKDVWPNETDGFNVFCTAQSPLDVKRADMVATSTSVYGG